ncbi:peptidylprolyl isomerase [Plakobranchus ocellatus]|uniref:peptidylprolyl isomerase n=1 Tax=Plakobranchus ocellatus TaxID=259542 RepID=A0AAV4AAA8_9GAST|nr:peptidylprolyl isomerase [Plakobranchus ocellatus]
MEDFSSFEKTGQFALNNALVFMLRGLTKKWKQPIAYYLSSGPTKVHVLQHLVIESIWQARAVGLAPKIVIWDQGSSNRAVTQRLGEGTNCQEDVDFFLFSLEHILSHGAPSAIKSRLEQDVPRGIQPLLSEQNPISCLNVKEMNVLTYIGSYVANKMSQQFARAEGWEEGVSGMCQGEKRRLLVPPHLGYGEVGFPSKIPPNATLLFEITLVKLMKAGSESKLLLDHMIFWLQLVATPALGLAVFLWLQGRYRQEVGHAKEQRGTRKNKRR